MSRKAFQDSFTDDTRQAKALGSPKPGQVRVDSKTLERRIKELKDQGLHLAARQMQRELDYQHGHRGRK